MPTQELSPSDLRAALDQFSQTHQGRRTVLEDFAQGEERREIRDLPLVGISADDRDGENQIVILLGDQPDRHLTHIVPGPVKVLLTEGENNEETVEIQAEGGRRIVLHCHANAAARASAS